MDLFDPPAAGRGARPDEPAFGWLLRNPDCLMCRLRVRHTVGEHRAALALCPEHGRWVAHRCRGCRYERMYQRSAPSFPFR